MRPPLRRAYLVVFWLAAAWTIVNCLYVYLVRSGAQAYRIESAVLILASLMVPLVVARRRQNRRVVAITPAARGALWIVVIGIWAVIFLPLVRFPFLSDDYVFLTAYRSFGDVDRTFQFYRPGFALVFVALSHLGRESPVPFHLASLLLHFGSASFVFLLAKRLFGSHEAAIVCFTVFLLNPVQLEAVLWISGLQELLWTFVLLAMLWFYTAKPDISPGQISAAVLLAAVGLASKETAVSFIALLPAADFLFFRFKRGPLLPIAYAAFVIELAGYLLIRRHFVSIEQDFLVMPSKYFLKQLLVIPYKVFVHPWNRSAFDVPLTVLCLIAVVVVVLLVLAVSRNVPGRALAGPALILLTTLPVYSYFFVGPDLAGSRYLYFPSVGWSLLIAEVLIGLVNSRVLFSAAILTLAVASALSLQLNLRPWHAAANLVEAMKVGLQEGRATVDIVHSWQERYGTTLPLKDGVPREYKGVGIFINGYAEFVRLTTDR